MVFEAPQYAYAFSWDDYVGHNLEGVALAGGSPSRSGVDLEAQLPFSPRGNPRQTPPETAGNDWRALLTGPDQVKGKRRTSSNISVVENFIPTIQASQLATIAGPAFAAVSPPATNGSVNDRTIRRLPTTLPTSPYGNYQRSSPPSPNSIFGADTENPGRRHEKSSGGEPYLSARAEQTQASGVRSGLRGMRNRVSVLKSRLVALTVPSSSSRSPSSPSFPPKHAVESYERRYPIPSASSSATVPSSSAQWPSASVFPTASSTSSLPSGSASSLHSSSSPWSPGFSRRHTSFPRPAATRPPFHGAI
ncbi:hypothetical protein DFH06DRAFT_125908 [Mycena polygramma]|nr:hypothetical protein DFH06DRAFT_125908 [Mycena polygramma]